MVYIAGMNRSVDTGDTYFDEISKKDISGSVTAKNKLKRGNIQRLPVSDGKPLEARIEHARYIIDCPNCNSAEFAFEDKLFFCSICSNSNVEGKILKVKMPKERKEIESILSKRLIVNRHWLPNETVSDLRKESLKMGVI